MKEDIKDIRDDGSSDLDYDCSKDEDGLRLGMYLDICVTVVITCHGHSNMPHLRVCCWGRFIANWYYRSYKYFRLWLGLFHWRSNCNQK